MNNQCSVLLLSCDKYIDVVELNLRYMEKYWPNCPFDIYLSLEKAEYTYNGILNIHVLHSDSTAWTQRVKEHLRAVPTKYVMITLDDFLIEDCVDNQKIYNALELLANDHKIANIAFAHFIGEKNEQCCSGIFECRVKNRPSLINWQIGVWNKDNLLELLMDEENPWESELLGSLRARYCSDFKFYCLNSDDNMPVKYGRGWLIVRGKWNSKEIKRIEAKCGIQMNPANRPIEEIEEIKTPLIDKIKNRIRIKKYESHLKSLSRKELWRRT